MPRPHFPLAVVLAAMCSVPSGAAGQQVRLTFDNDLIGLRGAGAPPDHDYTGGVRLEWSAPGGLLLELGQEIYTPRRDAAEPVPGERPYAAWLHAGVGWSTPAAGGRGARRLGIRVGVVGPAALGEEVQSGIHALTGSERQQGWAHQLRLGPTLQVRYRDGLRVPVAAGGWTLEPYAAAFAGTVRTGARLGVPLLLRMDPSLRTPTAGFGFGLDLSLRLTAADALLDRAPAGVEPVERHVAVGVGRVTAGYRFGRWAVAYGFSVLTREYRTQPAAHRYGSLTVTWTAAATSSRTGGRPRRRGRGGCSRGRSAAGRGRR